jgi:hypothetical protein
MPWLGAPKAEAPMVLEEVLKPEKTADREIVFLRDSKWRRLDNQVYTCMFEKSADREIVLPGQGTPRFTIYALSRTQLKQAGVHC